MPSGQETAVTQVITRICDTEPQNFGHVFVDDGSMNRVLVGVVVGNGILRLVQVLGDTEVLLQANRL